MLTDIFDKEIVKLITFDIKSVQKCMYIFEKILVFILNEKTC